jgi:hypothetical protein
VEKSWIFIDKMDGTRLILGCPGMFLRVVLLGNGNNLGSTELELFPVPVKGKIEGRIVVCHGTWNGRVVSFQALLPKGRVMRVGCEPPTDRKERTEISQRQILHYGKENFIWKLLHEYSEDAKEGEIVKKKEEIEKFNLL